MSGEQRERETEGWGEEEGAVQPHRVHSATPITERCRESMVDIYIYICISAHVCMLRGGEG